jgi:subtilisin
MSDPETSLPPYTIHDIGDIETLSQIYPQNIVALNIPRLWTKTKGRGIVVAVLDTGIQIHPDLIKNIDISRCRSFIPGETIFDNSVGHGIHCSGIIAAQNDEQGVVGVAPEATIVSIKVLDKTGRSQGNSVVDGLKYCLSLQPDVINLSLGNINPMPDAYEIIKKLVKHNIVIIASAGNNSIEGVLYPAAYEEVIAVGSYSNSLLKDRSLFSSYGDALDIMAPGEEIFSTFLNGQYCVMSGTSMSSPFVCGVVALLLSYYKNLNKTVTMEDVRKLLLTTASDIGKKGFDKESGWGIVDPDKLFSSLPIGIAIKKPSIWQKIKSLFK